VALTSPLSELVLLSGQLKDLYLEVRDEARELFNLALEVEYRASKLKSPSGTLELSYIPEFYVISVNPASYAYIKGSRVVELGAMVKQGWYGGSALEVVKLLLGPITRRGVDRVLSFVESDVVEFKWHIVLQGLISGEQQIARIGIYSSECDRDSLTIPHSTLRERMKSISLK